MRRLLLSLLVMIGLVFSSGCFGRSSAAVKKTEEGGNFDRFKKLKEGGVPKTVPAKDSKGG